jgi:hypothetical protein
MWNAVQGQLGDIPVTLRIEWVDELEPDMRSQVDQAREVAKKHDAMTVFWADLSVPDQFFLYISKSTGERILVRNIGSKSGGEEERLEILAVIVRSSVKAVLEGGEIGIQSPGDAQRPAKPGSSGMLEIAVSYGLAPYSTGNEWLHGPVVGVSTKLGSFVRAFLDYRILLPIDIEEQGIALEHRLHPFEIGAAVRWYMKSWSVDIGAAFLADLVVTKVTSADEQIEAKNPQNLWLFGIAPVLRIGWWPRPFATVFFSVSLDTIFNQPEYGIETQSEFMTIIEPWKVRPFLQIGAAFALL